GSGVVGGSCVEEPSVRRRTRQDQKSAAPFAVMTTEPPPPPLRGDNSGRIIGKRGQNSDVVPHPGQAYCEFVDACLRSSDFGREIRCDEKESHEGFFAIASTVRARTDRSVHSVARWPYAQSKRAFRGSSART